eukprot:7720024-Lingulodinium_polyedra.AAC.1
MTVTLLHARRRADGDDGLCNCEQLHASHAGPWEVAMRGFRLKDGIHAAATYLRARPPARHARPARPPARPTDKIQLTVNNG